MAYYNLYLTGYVDSLYNPTNQGEMITAFQTVVPCTYQISSESIIQRVEESKGLRLPGVHGP